VSQKSSQKEMKTVANLFIFGFLMFVLASIIEGIHDNITLFIAIVGASSILLGIIKSVSL
jgi:hypothetical protein